jgi:hypothetical protein
VTPCARLHPVPGVHAPACTCTRDCPDHEGHCRGCAPADATRGLLCDRDSRILRGMLGAEEGLDPDHPVHGLPWAWDALAEAYPSLTQAPGGGGSSIDDPEAERLAAVLSLRADISDVLGEWVKALVEQSFLTGPDLTVSVVQQPDASWYRRAGARHLSDRLRVRRRAEWLLTHIESLESHPAVSEAWQELADLMSRAHALAPWRPAPTHIRGVPCRCGETALHDHGDEVLCWACRKSYSREEYRVLTKVLARRFAPVPG